MITSHISSTTSTSSSSSSSSAPHAAWIPLPVASIKSGHILLLKELPLLPLPSITSSSASLSESLPVLSVRVIGRMIYYDAERSSGIIEDEKQQQSLLVDVSLIKEFEFTLNSLIQFIGELEQHDDNYNEQADRSHNETTHNNVLDKRWILRARVYRCMSGLDMAVFEQVVLLRRELQYKLGIKDTVYSNK